jgi:hypothetical protein
LLTGAVFAEHVPMKRFAITPLLTLLFVFTSFLSPAQEGSKPDILFESETFHHDTVHQGIAVDGYFYFRNTGGSPLIITSATSSCGCLVPAYSKEPIMPGECGIITTKLNTAGKIGIMDKVVTVMSNASRGNILLHVKAM